MAAKDQGSRIATRNHEPQKSQFRDGSSSRAGGNRLALCSALAEVIAGLEEGSMLGILVCKLIKPLCDVCGPTKVAVENYTTAVSRESHA